MKRLVGHWQGLPREVVPIPRGVQGTPGRGTQCSGLVDKVGIGHRLDSTISDVSSNP